MRTLHVHTGTFALSYSRTLVGFSCIFPSKGSLEFLLEGDLSIPKNRNAMFCLNNGFNCLWPKSADGNVWIPFVISETYGRWRYHGGGGGTHDTTSLFCYGLTPPPPRCRPGRG